MDLDAFAAQRDAELLSLADRLRPGIADALAAGGSAEAVLAALREAWVDIYSAEGGQAVDAAFGTLDSALGPALSRTVPDGSEAQVERMATWLSTAVLNHAALSAAPPATVKQWVTMLDEDVRESHEPLHGVKRLIGETFPVRGFGLRFPGEPVGPPDVWLNCRCVCALTPFTGILDLFQSETVAFGQHDLPASRPLASGVLLSGAGSAPASPVAADAPLIDVTALADPGSDCDCTRVLAAKDVDTLRDAFQVVGPDTPGVAAEVVENAVWFGTVGEFPGDAVREALLADGLVPQAPVSVVVDGSGPEPTAVLLVDVAPEPLGESGIAGRGVHRQASLGSRGVQTAEPVTFAAGGTAWVVAGSPRRSVGGTDWAVEGQTLLRSLGVGVAQATTASGPVADAHGAGHTVEFSGSHYLCWCKNRRTPQVVSEGQPCTKCGPDKAAGPVVKRRKATESEERTIRNGGWVRVNRDGKKPGDSGYMERKSKVRPQNNALEDVVDTDMKPAQDEVTGDCPDGQTWDEDLSECVPVEDAEPQGDGDDVSPMLEGVADLDLSSDDPMPFWAVLAPEGVWSGDKRRFAEGSLTNRDLPLPMLWQQQTGQGHDGSVVVGNIQRIIEVDNLRIGTGVFADTEEADKVIGLIADKHLRGVSVDVDDAEMEMGEDGGFDPTEGVTFTRGRISAATIVPIPAFAEAVIHLGEFDPDKIEQETLLAAAVDAVFRDFDAETRKRLAKSGAAMPDGSFPIVTEEDLRNAIQAIGRASDPAAAKEHIKKRARALGKGDLIPDGWSLLDDEAEGFSLVEEFRRGPGWLTDPKATRRIHAYWTTPGQPGYAKIRWGTNGDFTRCTRQLRKYVSPAFLYRTCAEWHHDALGYWPGELGKPGNPVSRKRSLANDDCDECTPQGVSLVASAPPVLDAAAFANPNLTGVTPLTITDDGRVFGHLAAWDQCHIGIKDVCVTAPPSMSQYAYFATGTVLTDDGPVRVGQITMDTGHADLSLDAFAAAGHYDHTGYALADVAVGDDTHGVWFAGLLRDYVDPDHVRRAMAAGQVSGDWREVRGNLELVASLVVNVPGFPIPRFAYRHGVQTALVAPLYPSRVMPLTASAEHHADLAAEVIRRLDNRARIGQMRAEVNGRRVAAMAAEVG